MKLSRYVKLLISLELAGIITVEEETMIAHRVGVDVGNGTVCAVDETGKSVFFPSFVAPTNKAYQGTGAPTTTRHFVTYKGKNYVAGEDAHEMPLHTSLMNESLTENLAHERYMTDLSFVAFLAGVSALYPDDETINIALGTGAPLSIFESAGAILQSHYVGKHEYSYMGKKRTLNIPKAGVFGEGAEALRLLSPELASGNVAVHDIGSRTYGVIFFSNGTLKRHRSFDAGIDRLFSDIASAPNDSHGRWVVRTEMRKNAKSHPEIRADLAALLQDTLVMIETKLAMGLADRHIVMGGGAPDAAPGIKARYGKPVIILNPKAPERTNAMVYALAAGAL